MTLREEIAQGENVALEFKEARPKDSLKSHRVIPDFATLPKSHNGKACEHAGVCVSAVPDYGGGLVVI